MVLCAGNKRLYWFCLECRQEMPDLVNVMMTARQHKHQNKTPQSSPLNPSSQSEQLAGV